MSILLSKYIEALKKRRLSLARDIEKDFLIQANSIEDWDLRDMYIENLTLASL